MFAILNRYRGEYAYFAWINGFIIALIVFVLTNNITVAVITGLGYVLGECFGWGKWIGAVIANKSQLSKEKLAERENSLGIETLVGKFINPQTHGLKFCWVCLALRGLVWYGFVFIPLAFVYGFSLLLPLIWLSIGFPLSFWLAIKTRKISFECVKLKFYCVTDWQRGEVYYGLMFDLALIYLACMI